MRKEIYTLMLVPYKTGRTVRLPVSRNFLSALFAIAVLLFNLNIFLTDRFLDSVNPLTHEEHLKAEIDLLKIQNGKYHDKIIAQGMKIEEFVAKMEEFQLTRSMGNIPSDVELKNDLVVEDLEDAVRTWELKADFWIERLDEQIKERKHFLANCPSIWPVEGWITCGYRWRTDPFTKKLTFHPAVDISARRGTPIEAPGDGEVIFVGWNAGYGKTIEIDHGYGLKTRYGHLHDYCVAEGQQVKRGDVIGKVGSTGRSTGPHLHYEIRHHGEAINPMPFLESDEGSTEREAKNQ